MQRYQAARVNARGIYWIVAITSIIRMSGGAHRVDAFFASVEQRRAITTGKPVLFQ